MYKPPYKGNRTYTVHTKIYQIETSPHRGCKNDKSLSRNQVAGFFFSNVSSLVSSVDTEVTRKSCLEISAHSRWLPAEGDEPHRHRRRALLDLCWVANCL